MAFARALRREWNNPKRIWLVAAALACALTRPGSAQPIGLAPARHFIAELPRQLAFVERAYRHWRAAETDTLDEDTRLSRERELVMNLYWLEREFVRAARGGEWQPEPLRPVLEFYDARVRSRLAWYAEFVSSGTWLELHQRMDPETMTSRLWHGGIRDFESLRRAQLDLLTRLLQWAEAVPEVYRRPYEMRLIKYDLPAMPMAGWAELQTRINRMAAERGLRRPAVAMVHVLVDEVGRLIRVRAAAGDSVDPALQAVFRSLKWKPATRDGQAVKMETPVPVRLWAPP